MGVEGVSGVYDVVRDSAQYCDGAASAEWIGFSSSPGGLFFEAVGVVLGDDCVDCGVGGRDAGTGGGVEGEVGGAGGAGADGGA